MPRMTDPVRLPELSYFFPAYNEEANVAAMVDEALVELPKLAECFEIIIVNDGSRDRTGEIADELAAAHPDVVRAVHHRPTNLGYGAALRSGFAAARSAFVAFTDGDRQFRLADLLDLTEVIITDQNTDGVIGFRIKRADPLMRSVQARVYGFALDVVFRLGVRDVDCAMKLFRTSSPRRRPRRQRWNILQRRDTDPFPRGRSPLARGAGAALSAHRRISDRRQALRGAPRHRRLLATAAAQLVRPRPRGPQRATPALEVHLAVARGGRWWS